MPAIPTTPKSQRWMLAQPIAVNEAMGWGGELEAVDAIYAAYMALNAVGHREGGESHLAWEDGPSAPMALVAKGAIAALARIPGVGDVGGRKIWNEMIANASGARWCYDLWRNGEI